MKLIITIIPLFLASQAFSQVFKEKELKTEINEVTVFLNGAQVFESGKTSVPTDKTVLRIKNLSPFIDEKSIQAKIDGGVTILSVNHRLNYLNELKKDKSIDSLETLVDASILTVDRANARLAVLGEKQSLLDENKNLGGQTSGATLTQLKQAIAFYEVEYAKIKEEEIGIKKSIETEKKELAKLGHQLDEMKGINTLPTSEIELRISSEIQVNAKISLSYLVANAGWYSKYDIRVGNIESPLELTYKAEVFQNTGTDWKNVKLRFSNGDPNQSGLVPELNTWNLNYARNTRFENSIYGMLMSSSIKNVRGTVTSEEDFSSLPGVNVVVKGTTIGTVTDINGNYNLTLPNNASTLIFSFIGLKTQEIGIASSEINVRMQPDVTQLSEVVEVGYGAEKRLKSRVPGIKIRGNNSITKTIATSIVENQTTVEIEVASPYSIKSNGETLKVDLRKYQIEAIYEYYAIPKLDRDAFLVAQIINWDKYNLLEGEVNLYFEDAFVGRSILNTNSLQDTLTVSLGRDKNILTDREKNEEFSKKQTLGGNKIESRSFNITVRNKKSQPIKLTVIDQIPVSVISDITVSPVELTKGHIEEKTGKVSWKLKLDGQQQKELNLQYEVKYPKRERIILE